MKDFYYILGTDVNCSFDEIKDAYRKLSKKFHPDLNQGNAYFESRFKEVQEAYETLIDPSRRLVYDAALKKSKSNQPRRKLYESALFWPTKNHRPQLSTQSFIIRQTGPQYWSRDDYCFNIGINYCRRLFV